jgi:hypothetical protein
LFMDCLADQKATIEMLFSTGFLNALY